MAGLKTDIKKSPKTCWHGWTNTSWLVGGRVQKSGLLNKHIVKNIVVGWWVGG